MSSSEALAPEQHDTLDGIPGPAETCRVRGHAEPRQALAAARAAGRLHHAWLFQGPRGIGKATSAFEFARALLTPPDADPPTAAAVRRQIAQGSHPNLLHIARPPVDRGSGFRTQITVDEVRRLNRFFHATTGRDAWRVAIVDPADDMNRSAANALLKILEEPPARSVFLIVNHAPGRILPTIRSRCRVLRFEPLDEATLATVLADLPVAIDPGEAQRAAALAEGSVRTAIAMALSGGLEVEERLRRLYAAPQPEWSEIHAVADALVLKGRESAHDLLVEGLFRALAEEAEARLVEDAAGAARLAEFWRAERNRFAEAAAYNLDRKQTLLSFFAGLAELRSAAAPSDS
ncbi:DNA polymerase III subunit delta' [Mangrovibrevibacter kandeliae]|uniref:DNA polymerase III subunit delta' n=1 Tax=Mangrovibrevibacter kandeliae TaxID=2968473 RepID=UPI002117856D|nr:DNA polymerase III subunit delta' [Aurantimonas sp. CSK15Z-1]